MGGGGYDGTCRGEGAWLVGTTQKGTGENVRLVNILPSSTSYDEIDHYQILASRSS